MLLEGKNFCTFATSGGNFNDITYIKNRRNYGDSLVMLNSKELSTKNPVTLVMGGSERSAKILF